MLDIPTLISDNILSVRIERGRSNMLPFSCRNLVVQEAYGPKSSDFFPFIIRVSRCGTAIVGADPGEIPYTLALCCLTRFGDSETSHWPPIGKPARPLA